MIFETIIGPLAQFIILTINKLGYFGVILAMAIESACIPLPSEIIMPFSGFLVSRGIFNFWLVVICGATGCLVGSLAAFLVGFYGGETLVRVLIKKYGKFFLVFEYEFEEAKEWFAKHGQIITFTSRLLPVVRTFISLPAGISGMDIKSFAFYTFIGSLIWSAVLAYFGMVLGKNWNTLGVYFHQFDVVILLLGCGLVAFYIYHKLTKHHRYLKRQKASK
jgi:membrane protein DedA with SNARE-associated domain